MSHEIHVRASHLPSAGKLIEALAGAGWGSRVLDPRGRPMATGSLEDVLVLGWCTAWASPPHEGAALDGLSRRYYAAVPMRCTVTSGSAVLTVWTSAGRSPLAAALQNAIARALAAIADGRVEDEVTGTLAEIPTPVGPELERAVVGGVAPEIELSTSGGSAFSLRALRGKNVVLLFFPSGPDTPVTRAEMTSLSRSQTFARKYAELVGICQFSAADAVGLVKAYGFSFPLVCDRQASTARAYDAEKSRMTVVIGTDGVIRGRVEREAPDRLGVKLLTDLKRAFGTQP